MHRAKSTYHCTNIFGCCVAQLKANSYALFYGCLSKMHTLIENSQFLHGAGFFWIICSSRILVVCFNRPRKGKTNIRDLKYFIVNSFSVYSRIIFVSVKIAITQIFYSVETFFYKISCNFFIRR